MRIYMYIIIIIIIITSRSKHESPWPSLITCLYCPSLVRVLQDYILYRHRAVGYSFLLVVLPFLVHVKGSTRVYCLCFRPYFSCSVLYVLFVKHESFFMIDVRMPYSSYFCGMCFQDLFNTLSNILMIMASSLFSIRLVSLPVAWKKNCVLFYWSGLTSIWPIGYR